MKNGGRSGKIESGNGRFSKQIGSTTYLVSIHFSRTGKESFEDKILHLIESLQIKSQGPNRT